MKAIPEHGSYIYDHLSKDIDYRAVGITKEVSEALQALVHYEMNNKDFHRISVANSGHEVYLYIYDFEDQLITVSP